MVNGLADFIGKALDDDALDAIRELVRNQAVLRAAFDRGTAAVGALARKLTVRLAG